VWAKSAVVSATASAGVMPNPPSHCSIGCRPAPHPTLEGQSDPRVKPAGLPPESRAWATPKSPRPAPPDMARGGGPNGRGGERLPGRRAADQGTGWLNR